MKRQTRCKWISLFICMLCICVLCFSVSAETAYDDFEIDGTTLVRYIGNGGEVTVPDGITEIGEWAFDSSAITKLILPETLKAIRSYAFFNCTDLREITLPASLTELEKSEEDNCYQPQIFYNNERLPAINVAEGNPKYISIDGVLYTANGEKLLFYPAGKNRGGQYTVPEGTKEIGYSAFGEAHLTSIHFPSTLELIYGDGSELAFVYGLQEITVSDKNKHFYTKDGILYDRTGTLYFYPSWKAGETLEKESFPRTLNEIGAFAFQNNQYLKSVELPEGVRNVGWMAFDKAQSIEKITFPASVSSISGYVFSDCPKLQKVIIPNPRVNFLDYGDLGADIFTGSNFNLVLCGPADSKVQDYADDWGISFEPLESDTTN